jgi:membrane protease YdiL (CAAX protease family)
VTALLKRSFDYKRIRAKVWYVPIVLLMPGLYALTYALMRLMGLPLAAPQFPVPMAAVLVLAFFIMALGEELGWMGYAIDPMQDRWNALQAGILLGLVWAVWHILAIVQDGQSPAFIAWACLDMVGTRVLAVWLYNNTGKSVFAISLLHVTGNLKWILFPGGFSYSAQLIVSLIIAVAAAIVTVVWGPRTLARYRTPDQVGQPPRKVLAIQNEQEEKCGHDMCERQDS